MTSGLRGSLHPLLGLPRIKHSNVLQHFSPWKMERMSCICRIMLYLLLICIVAKGYDSMATNFYISRVYGDDSWPCDQIKPCKTIWRAVTLASHGDIIHLDGTNTEEDPYTCQSTHSRGLYINTSLVLKGFGPIPPQVRCPPGTGLTFDGSRNAQKMNVTLSGLLVNESFVYFLDCSANISGCKFVRNKQGVRFVISSRMVSDVLIANSIFLRNSGCISVIVNSTVIPSQIIRVTFTLISSSFSGNTMSDSGNFLSFTESTDNNQSVNCSITLKNVSFSVNNFSSKGLFFLEFRNGNHDFQLYEVILTGNRLSWNKNILTGHEGHSEFIFNSRAVNIFINASNFTGHNARSFHITAVNTSLQIHNSRFHGHHEEANGGVVSLITSHECRLNISYSSFVNTTANQGGAIHAECVKVKCTLHDNIFTGNRVTGRGGALYLSVLFSGSNTDYEMERGFHSSKKSEFDLVLFMENVRFKGCSAGNGGSLSVLYGGENLATGVVNINNSYFISNSAVYFGGALLVTPLVLGEDPGIRSQITIQGSTFINNTAGEGGAAMYLFGNNKQGILNIENVIMESNRVSNGGGAVVVQISLSVKIRNSRFVKNTASFGGVFYIFNVEILEITGSYFVSNYALGQNGVGGALFISSLPLFGSTCQSCPVSVTIRDTKFEGNVAKLFGGAVFLSTTFEDEKQLWIFRNCFFIDNFAILQEGSHIKISYVKGRVLIQESIFKQSMDKPQLQNGMVSSDESSFIGIERFGTLIMANTTVEAKAYNSGKLLIRLIDGWKVDLGNDNLTKFICPVGSKIKFISFAEEAAEGSTTVQFSCSTCEGNSYSLQRGRALGTQLVTGFQCLPCPFGANCSQNILAKRDFWGFKERQNSSALTFSMCPVGYCSRAKAIDFPEYNSCQGNRSGVLCGKCKHNYSETLYSPECRPTHQCNDYWFWPVALVYISLMALYLTFKPPVVPWLKRQILWFKNNAPGNQDINFDKGYLKILFYFYQAANLFLISSSSQSVIKTKFVEPIVEIFNFKSSSLGGFVCPFPGFSVITKQLFSASYVFGTSLVICAIYGVVCGVQRFRGKVSPSVGPYVGGILQTMLLGYTTLASTSFNLLRCVPVGGESRLFYDGNRACYQWWQYFLIGFTCGYFIPFVFVLLWGSYKLYGETLSAKKFLLACLLPLPSLIYWSIVVLVAKRRDTAAEDSASSPEVKKNLERVLYDPFKRPEEGSKVSLSWEVVMIGRRLILAALRSFISDPLPRVVIMSLLSVLFLLHHAFTLPFRDSIANVTETISLVFIVLVGLVNVFFSSFLSLGVSFDDAPHFSCWRNVLQAMEMVILFFAPTVLVILVVTAALSQLCRLIGVIYRVVYNFWSCCRACQNNQTEERRSLVEVAS